ELAVGVALDAPTALVDKAMMGRAQEGHVPHVGGATVSPMADVVPVDPAPPLAAREPAPAVAPAHGPVEPGGHGATGPAHAHQGAVGAVGRHLGPAVTALAAQGVEVE